MFDSYEDVVARNQMLSTNWTMCVYNTIHIFIDGQGFGTPTAFARARMMLLGGIPDDLYEMPEIMVRGTKTSSVASTYY